MGDTIWANRILTPNKGADIAALSVGNDDNIGALHAVSEDRQSLNCIRVYGHDVSCPVIRDQVLVREERRGCHFDLIRIVRWVPE